MNENFGIDKVILLILTAAVVLFCSPLFKNILYISANDDWFNFFKYNHFDRLCVLRYHQLPLWSPYSGGGFPIIGRAYAGSINPLFIFVLIFGEIVGLKIIVLIIYFAAITGMYYLTRFVLNFHPFASAFSAVVFTFSGYIPSFVSDGNYNNVYIYFLPWALAFLLKSVYAEARVKYIILSCISLSPILLQGGLPFVVALGLIFLVSVFSMFRFNRKKKSVRLDFRYLKIFLVVVLLTLSICAVKIFPTVKTTNSKVAPVHSVYEDNYEAISRYAVEKGKALSWSSLYSCLFVRNFRGILPTYYVGFIPVIFFLLSLFIRPKKNLKWLFVFVIFLFLSMGPLAPFDLFKFLWASHKYIHFIYKHNKYFSIGIIFTIAILGGSFLSYFFRKRYARKSVKYITVGFLSVLSVIAFLDLFATNIKFHKNIFTLPVPELKEEKNFFQIFVKGIPLRDPICMHEYFYLLRNVGLINWHGDILLKESAEPKYYTVPSVWEDFDKMELNPSYRGEFYFLTPSNKVECSYFSPCKLILDVEVREPGFLVVNQNYHPAWHSTAGKVYDYNGLLAISLKMTGRYKVVLYYVPMEFWLGAAISLLTLSCLSILFIKYEIKRKDKYRI